MTHLFREVIQLPETMPREAPEALWTLQLELLSMAESILGHRDIRKKIYSPQFSDEGPCIRNTPNLDGAFAELSRVGECYWPTVVFEMAHETVHLLNPFPETPTILKRESPSRSHCACSLRTASLSSPQSPRTFRPSNSLACFQEARFERPSESVIG